MQFRKSGYGSFGGLNHPNITLDEADLLLVGIPYDSASSGKKGSAQSPSTLRDFSKNLQLVTRRNRSIENFKILDLGDVPVHNTDENRNFQLIYSSLKLIFNQTTTPVLTIGGDHSIAYPEIKALEDHGKIGVIWIDAHRDLLNELDGSIYSHGCSLRRLIETKTVSPENVLLIGTRYFTIEESEYVEKNCIQELSMAEIEDSTSPRELIKNTILDLSNRVDVLSLSIDIDGVDPSAAPGTGTPVAGGLSSNLVLNIMSDFPAPLRSVDIVEVSPPLDTLAGITTKLQMAIITELCGKFQKWKN